MAVKDILQKKTSYSTEVDEYKSKFNFEEFEITDKKTNKGNSMASIRGINPI